MSSVRANRHALAELRERSGYSKSHFARDVGISTGTLSDVESGRRNPSPDLLKRMAAVLKVPLPALLWGSEDAA